MTPKPPPETPSIETLRRFLDANYQAQKRPGFLHASEALGRLTRDLSAALARAERAEVERDEARQEANKHVGHTEFWRNKHDGAVFVAASVSRERERLQARVSALEAALRELVRLKDLKDRWAGFRQVAWTEAEQRAQDLAEYERAKPLAWEVASSLTPKD